MTTLNSNTMVMFNTFDPDIDYRKTGDASHASPAVALRNDCPVKVSKKLAQRILMNDITVTRLGKVRYLQLKDIGLGVYEVRLLPAEGKIYGEEINGNRLVKSFY